MNAVLLALDEHAEELLEIHNPEAARALQVRRRREANPSLVADRFKLMAREHNKHVRAASKPEGTKRVRVKTRVKEH